MAAFQIAAPFAFAFDSLARSVSIALLLWAGCRFYTRYRINPELAALLGGITQIILFSIMGAILSYMLAAQAGPQWDGRLQGWDRTLGFDWAAYLAWVNAHPTIGRLYHWAYVTLIPQLLVLVVALSWTGRLRAMRIVIIASILSGMLAVIISGVTPAVSNYVHLGLSGADFSNLNPAAAFVHQADFVGLRDGSLRVIDVAAMEGIITFPSYHAALGAIVIWGFFTHWWRWLDRRSVGGHHVARHPHRWGTLFCGCVCRCRLGCYCLGRRARACEPTMV